MGYVCVAILIAICGLCCVSKIGFNRRIKDLMTLSSKENCNSGNLKKEIDRIRELQKNLAEIRIKVDKLDIPTPENINNGDDTQSSLNKMSRYFEKHTSATVGTEQMILMLLPHSQINESLHSLAQIVPPHIGHAVFGDALAALKDGIGSISTTACLEKFVDGATHLSKIAVYSMRLAVEQHNLLGACLTPIKAGAMEALGINDAAHNLVNSLHNVGSEMLNAAATNVDVSGLTDVSNVDITGHLPVITIALSSFREIQLLSDDKTDIISSLRNITLDAVGTGGGAIVGAQLGAVAGSVAGPVGTLAGSIIGAIGGAMGGRRLTNRIKMRPLKKAIREYEQQYSIMKAETTQKSASTARNIKAFADKKRTDFKNSPFLKDIPITDGRQTMPQIALILYQFIVNETVVVQNKTSKLRRSIWFSKKKHEAVLMSAEREIEIMKEELPPIEYINDNPGKAIGILLNVKMPNRKSEKGYQSKINECAMELKSINDKNNSAVLFWANMVNNQYQQTMNDIAKYSNNQVKVLNEVFKTWQKCLSKIEKKIVVEKGKLGLA